jgi:microcystin-dependent protein
MVVHVRPKLVLAMLASAAALHLVLAACGQSSSSTAQCQTGNCAGGGAGQGGAGLAPSGSVMAFAGATPPAGWLACDGNAVSRTQYASLFAAIGTAHGGGDGVNTFALPDYRGRFLRGVDDGQHRDPDAATRTAAASGGNAGDAVGSLEVGAYAAHTHAVVDPGHAHAVTDPGHSHGVQDPGHGHTGCMGEATYWQNPGGTNSGYTAALLNVFNGCFPTGMVQPSGTNVSIAAASANVTVQTSEANVTVSASGGSENRPANAAVIWIIKS